VTTPGIPILIRSPEPRKADGLLVLAEDAVLVRLVEAGNLLTAEGFRRFEEEVGAVPESSHAAVFALLRLAQLTKTGTRRDLDAYIRLQAGAEVRGEINLLERIVGGFRGEANKVLQELLLASFRNKGKKLLEREESEIRRRMGRAEGLSVAIELSREINRWLRGARVVLWWPRKDKRLTLGLYCEKAETALASTVLATIDVPQGIAVCVRCGSYFMRIKRGQKYCKLRCGNADRKARERAKKGRK
jgi:hypothetical protein